MSSIAKSEVEGSNNEFFEEDGDELTFLTKRVQRLLKNVNVWIQGFDDAKVESNNKVVSTNIQRLSIASRIIQGQSKQDQEKKWNES